MHFKRSTRRWFKGFAGLAALFALAACGGGGGGGGGGGDAGLTYSGVTTQAALTDANSAELTSGAYRGGDISGSLGGALASASGGVAEANPATPRPLVISAFIGKVLEGAKGNLTVANPNQRAVVALPVEEIPGTCGGTARYSLFVDDATGALDGTISFNSFCQDGVTSNGLVDISGAFDIAGESFGTMTISFTSLTVTSPEDSFTMAGNVVASATTSQNTQTMTMNLLIRDNALNEVSRIENYLITATAILDYTQVTMSGRFYHPAEGYVDLSTLAPLKIYNDSDWPFEGALQATGQAGGTATLTAVDEFNYFLEVDGDGDGFIDYTEEGPWELL